MIRFFRTLAWLVLTAPAVASAAVLPVDVDVNGDTTTARVGSPLVLFDLRLDFDAAEGLTPAALGVSADTVSITDPTLLARLPSVAVSIPAGLPVLTTVEPPMLGGLAFDRRVHVELHTHLLAYTANSRYRLFKASLGGDFRDITSSVEPGSVRTRGTTGGFSQFLVVLDLRPTDEVVAEKIAWLRSRIDLLPPAEAAPLHYRLSLVEAAVAEEDWAMAGSKCDVFRARVANRAGTYFTETWSADGSTVNHAGELLSGIDTLEFSIEYLRDFGP